MVMRTPKSATSTTDRQDGDQRAWEMPAQGHHHIGKHEG
jgi:hypothetical protein